MKEMEFEQVMHRYSFAKAGDIVRSGDFPAYQLTHSSTERGWVYLWVELAGDDRAIVYVGMAGKTLRGRCAQHLGGFRKSTTGKAHAQRLLQGHAKGRSYQIYARKSETLTVHGEAGIPMCPVEELAFIQKFQPMWNKKR